MSIQWTEEMLAKLRDMRERHAPYAICAYHLDVSYEAVKKKCVQLGLDGRTITSDWRSWLKSTTPAKGE